MDTTNPPPESDVRERMVPNRDYLNYPHYVICPPLNVEQNIRGQLCDDASRLNRERVENTDLFLTDEAADIIRLSPADEGVDTELKLALEKKDATDKVRILGMQIHFGSDQLVFASRT